MELIDQHTKRIMEGCKRRARDAGLEFHDETLEYIVTNRDLLELSPKVMIPTLYDYWVHDVEVLRERGKYELYPHNPFETVINTRPAISFYNDNNPDWLNVMIFYHVLAHVDFFQNNLYFRHTWDADFTAEALSDKRMIARLRSEKGRWVDYVIEFARGIDNLIGYHAELARLEPTPRSNGSPLLDYYFDIFLQAVKHVPATAYIKEIERYNACVKAHGADGERVFFTEVERRHPEFRSLYQKHKERTVGPSVDLLNHLMRHSPVLRREENRWMESILQVVRKTSLFFQPQIRTKIMNEGWASYWHEVLFLSDDRIRGHEVDFARVNAAVTSLPRIGLNPYALGMRLFQHIEEMADKGRLSLAFERERDEYRRQRYDTEAGGGRAFIFGLRESLDDFLFINTYVDQDFINRHKLFVVGRRLNEERMTWQYFVKSRRAEDYRRMLLEALYHPPHVVIDPDKSDEDTLYLVHRFEEKPLVKEYIQNVLIGIEFLWGGAVKLETSEVKSVTEPSRRDDAGPDENEVEIEWERVLYTMEDRKLARETI
jgi:stage V sporulation protein R